LELVQFVLVLVLLAAVVAVVSAPLRARRDGPADEAPPAADVAALEAARDAKYREIRDAELDFSTGKLSEDDFRALERTLRAEALEILRALDGARANGDPARHACSRPGP
jgi:hypothetical protein